MSPLFKKVGVAKWDSERCLKAGDPDSPTPSALNKATELFTVREVIELLEGF